jgi:pimeloyl-ACP methyl ester carboxylesterase
VFDTAWLRQCRREVEQRADPRLYTSDNAADDLDDVRAALGYQQVSLYGGSYGTRLAQVYMRRFPQRTRAVVIDGVMPLDARVPLTYAATALQALDHVIDDCAYTPACQAQFPALAKDFDRLLSRFREGPVNTTVTPAGRPAVPVTMSRGDFGYAIRGILYNARGAQELPELIAGAAATGDLSQFAQRYWERQVAFSRTFSTGLHLSVLCAEDVPFIKSDEIAEAGADTFLDRYLIDEYRRACAEWPAAAVQAGFMQPVSGSVPTLLISGYFDPVTPPGFADNVAKTLSVSRHEVARHGAHGSVGFCTADALRVLQTGSLDGVTGTCR